MALAKSLATKPKAALLLSLAAEVTAYDLNHRPRRCRKGRTACAVFHDQAQRLRWTQRQRQTIFRLLLRRFGAMIGETTKGRHPAPATRWRVTVEAWLRCQGLIAMNMNLNTKFLGLTLQLNPRSVRSREASLAFNLYWLRRR